MIFNLITKAKQLFYNNKESGLSATDVQGAIDEVNAKAATAVTITKELDSGNVTRDGLIFSDGVTLVSGGYSKIGKLIVVNMRLILTSEKVTSNVLVSGLPIYGGQTRVSVQNNKNCDIGLTPDGAMQAANTVTIGTLVVSACYVCI